MGVLCFGAGLYDAVSVTTCVAPVKGHAKNKATEPAGSGTVNTMIDHCNGADATIIEIIRSLLTRVIDEDMYVPPITYGCGDDHCESKFVDAVHHDGRAEADSLSTKFTTVSLPYFLNGPETDESNENSEDTSYEAESEVVKTGEGKMYPSSSDKTADGKSYA